MIIEYLFYHLIIKKMKLVKLALAVLVSSVLGNLTSFAAPYPEVSCNKLPSSNSCSQCFDAGAVYE
jgi:hypothetical protein